MIIKVRIGSKLRFRDPFLLVIPLETQKPSLGNGTINRGKTKDS